VKYVLKLLEVGNAGSIVSSAGPRAAPLAADTALNNNALDGLGKAAVGTCFVNSRLAVLHLLALIEIVYSSPMSPDP
jgi:hypothetical protein